MAGKPKYPWDKYPKEVAAFIWMQKRVKRGAVTSVWPRSLIGFRAFLSCVGRIPKNMVQPSLGRKNHKKGYQRGNCFWQEWYDNHTESSRRPANRRTRSIRLKRLWKDVRYRTLMTALAKAQSHNRERQQQGRFA